MNDSDRTGEKLEISLHIALSTFNEIIGPELIIVTPPINNLFANKINRMIPHLLDINLSDLHVSPFLFSHDFFHSYNLQFSLPQINSRGGLIDYLVSIIITPADTRGLIALVGLENFIDTIKQDLGSPLNDFHINKDEHKLKTEVNQLFLSFHTEVREFLSAQLDVWGKGKIDLSDFIE